jgi:hypothetical protein
MDMDFRRQAGGHRMECRATAEGPDVAALGLRPGLGSPKVVPERPQGGLGFNFAC